MKYIKISFTHIILLLVAISLFLSAQMVIQSNEDNFFCVDETSCNQVQNSIYGEIMGFKVNKLGTIGFTLLFVAFLIEYKHKKKTLSLGLSTLGALFALYFLYIQFFVLKTLCSQCLIIDFSMLLIFYLAIKQSPFSLK
tara:strand:- start:372 stop:788 length:417 start_codon:yes stop_codon:yes gene_type:complete